MLDSITYDLEKLENLELPLILKHVLESKKADFKLDSKKKLLNSNLYIQFDKKDKIKLKLFSISPQLYICIMGLYEKWMNRNTNY